MIIAWKAHLFDIPRFDETRSMIIRCHSDSGIALYITDGM